MVAGPEFKWILATANFLDDFRALLIGGLGGPVRLYNWPRNKVLVEPCCIPYGSYRKGTGPRSRTAGAPRSRYSPGVTCSGFPPYPTVWSDRPGALGHPRKPYPVAMDVVQCSSRYGLPRRPSLPFIGLIGGVSDRTRTYYILPWFSQPRLLLPKPISAWYPHEPPQRGGF